MAIAFSNYFGYKYGSMEPKTEEVLSRIKEWCDEKRGRRSRLAEHLGVTVQYVSDWLCGRKYLSSEAALGMSELLNDPKKLRQLAAAKPKKVTNGD